LATAGAATLELPSVGAASTAPPGAATVTPPSDWLALVASGWLGAATPGAARPPPSWPGEDAATPGDARPPPPSAGAGAATPGAARPPPPWAKPDAAMALGWERVEGAGTGVRRWDGGRQWRRWPVEWWGGG